MHGFNLVRGTGSILSDTTRSNQGLGCSSAGRGPVGSNIGPQGDDTGICPTLKDSRGMSMGGMTLGACASGIAGYGGTVGHWPPLAPSARNEFGRARAPFVARVDAGWGIANQSINQLHLKSTGSQQGSRGIGRGEKGV